MLAQSLLRIQQDAFPNSNIGYTTTLGDIIGILLPYIFGAAGIALLIYLVIGGFQFMLSRGDPKSAQAAKSKITNAIIGFVIVILAFTIVQLLGQIFGIGGTAFGQIFGIK